MLKKITTLFLIIPFLMKGQTQNTKGPFTFEASYVGDLLSNFDGGLQKGSTYMGMANITLQFDTEKANLWKGGEFFFNGSHTHGGEATAELIGDFQTASNIEAGNITYIHELWYRQQVHNFSITLGLQDLNSELLTNEFGSSLINSSFGIPSNYAYNIPSPIFPKTSYGINVRWDINNSLAFQTAGFGCNGSNFDENPYNLEFDFSKDGTCQFFNELIYTQNISDRDGEYKLGNYYHRNNALSGDTINNYGFYLIANQELLKTNQRILGAFTQICYSPNSYSLNPFYLGLGLNYKGVFAKRANDEISLGIGYSEINHQKITNETVIELNYNLWVNENISVKPDLQYIINPAGLGTHLENAIVGTLRIEVSF